MLEPLAAYIHFPWCVRKCPYCDFNSHPLKANDDLSAYTDALISDWRQQQQRLSINNLLGSVFLGGGTPSLFTPEHIHTVLENLPLDEDSEVTMEANPGTTEHSNFNDYRNAGVNRLSIGAQSFHAPHLEALGRIHQAVDTRRAFEQARVGGFTNINLDLMWGLPEQTVDQALADLETAIGLKCEHISWYQLTLEPKTEFFRRPPLLPADDTLADIERFGLEMLADAGYQRYEVSAFALNGQQCRHNVNYWSFGDYLGIGAGAHGKLSQLNSSRLEVTRTSKAKQPRLYLQAPEHTDYAAVAPEALALEFMMNALRLVDGVSKDRFVECTGQQWSGLEHTWQRLVEQNLVEPERCATTPLGMRYLDSVVAEFL